ncbi:hypothetical protein [Thermodesulfovibrio yellowstonii]|jgi:hypothetical protein|uniref:hypothetical protein n=1 Tax=Thermodesulfovibrio yellowstonii TaxID=28262 RepID=UPI003C7C403F
MPIEFGENRAVFRDVVTIEDAEPLFEWLLNIEEATVDMSECEHIHTAVLQLILLFVKKLKLQDSEKFNMWF